MKHALHIIRLDTVDSTSTYIRNHPGLWDRQFCAVVAREQTGGRGRFDRRWVSEPGLDLTFSLVYLPPRSATDISCITMLAGLAVHRALIRHCTEGLNLKWPNDIRWKDKKIGGILCEMVPDEDRAVIIIGIGLNVNSTRFPEKIAARAASLKTVGGKDIPLNSLFEEIMFHCIELFSGFRVPLDPSLIREWEGASRSIGERVKFVDHGRLCEGVLSSINPDGSLRIISGSGDIQDGYRGEVLFPDDE